MFSSIAMSHLQFNQTSVNCLCTVKSSNSSISNNSVLHMYTFFVYRQLNLKTALFQTIQFSISTQFKCLRVLFDLLIGPYQVLPLQARVDLGVMEMKGYSAFPKLLALLKPHHQIV